MQNMPQENNISQLEGKEIWPPIGPKYYWSDSSIAIIHGDARDYLADCPMADIVLIDIPYGQEWRSNHRAVKWDKIQGDDKLPRDLLDMAIAKARRAAYCFCRWNNLVDGDMPKPTSVIAWVKNNWSMGDLEHEHGRQWEAICFYARPEHQFIKRVPDVMYADRTGNRYHPSEKPVGICGQLLACSVGDTVLDCFAGGGSTLIAARNHGRKCVGVEIDENHCKTMVARLSQQNLDL